VKGKVNTLNAFYVTTNGFSRGCIFYAIDFKENIFSFFLKNRGFLEILWGK